MTDTTPAAGRTGFGRVLPLLAVALLAAGVVVLAGDKLTLETLARHHAALIAFRDAHYLLAVAAPRRPCRWSSAGPSRSAFLTIPPCRLRQR